MNDQPPDDEQPDDLIYEDLDDLSWVDNTEPAPIDLDALDDEITPVQRDEATQNLLEAIAELDAEIKLSVSEDEAVIPTAEKTTGDQTEAEETAASTATPQIAGLDRPGEFDRSGAEAEPPPALPDVIYHALLILPPDLGAQVLKLREIGQISEMPPPGVGLATAFRAADLPAVKATLTDWARAHLPLQLEISGVLAEVIGAQQYVAAWALQPEEELDEAQQELRQALAPLIVPLSDMPGTFQVRVTIGDHIAPQPYPQVIGQMQHDFEPYVWHATSASLVRSRPESGTGEWETVGSFD